jgi:hypothetical protein
MSPKLPGQVAYSSEKSGSFCKIIPTPAFMPAFFVPGGCVPPNELAEVLH